MLEHTIDRTEEISHIYNFYGIQATNQVRKNDRGLVNITYEINGKYYLTVMRRRNSEEVNTIAAIANRVSKKIPIAQPMEGVNGYSINIGNHPSLITSKLPGEHKVGIAHTEKYPINIKLHQQLSSFFWKLQAALTKTPHSEKQTLASNAVTNVEQLPCNLPPEITPLTKYQRNDDQTQYYYPDLIHDDLERQNILSVDTQITGLVDLDSLRTGDILYEFSHFLFNFALCSPDASHKTIEIYIGALIKAGIIEPSDIPLVYQYIYQFVIRDIVEFKDLRENPSSKQHQLIDIPLLVQQYDKALSLALDFFKREFSI